jgi:putative OPT family oligopeptide transporter
MAQTQAAVSEAQPTDVIPAVDFVTPQLTLKSLLTGAVLGGLLSICNVYAGLKIGWGLNMSITGILLAFAFWFVIQKITAGSVRNINKLENNVNQSAVSAAGAVSSAGLVSAIPALEMLEGVRLTWFQLFLWISVVCLVGIAVAMGLRKQMIVRDKLAFPGGLSCATTLNEVYAKGSEALVRVGILGLAAVFGSAFKLLEILKVTASTHFGLSIAGKPANTFSFALDPTLLMIAVGGLVGFRACWSLMLGAIVAWGVIGTQLATRGFITPSATLSERKLVGEWLLWPGVTLMVVASLVSFSFSFPAILRAFKRSGSDSSGVSQTDEGEVSRKWFIISIVVSLVLCLAMQMWLFGISWWAAAIAVLLSFALAIVASRVSGETNVTPVGAMGKVTQLTFAGLMPANSAANLMSASVTAGAASQCADLMHDLKCGYLLGGVARYQVVSQAIGAIAGAAVGSYFYLILVPDPKTMLITDEWAAPAVSQWKAVAEVFKNGISSLPSGAMTAMMYAAALGVVLPIIEQYAPKKWKQFIPSPSAVGLAFVISASNSISMFIGGCIALAMSKIAPKWTTRFLVIVCAGIIAGESLTGAGDAIRVVIAGMNK